MEVSIRYFMGEKNKLLSANCYFFETMLKIIESTNYKRLQTLYKVAGKITIFELVCIFELFNNLSNNFEPEIRESTKQLQG